MKTARLKILIYSLGVVLLTSTMGSLHAQSGSSSQSFYTRNQLSRLTSSANGSRYTSDRFRNQVRSGTIPQFSYSNANRDLARNMRRSTTPSKPFSNFSRGPTVTPYLGLSRPFGGVGDIYTIRQQRDQQRSNQQQQRVNSRQQQENQKLQNRLNKMAAKTPYNTRGSETMTPTGHAAVFMDDRGFRMNYGGFYTQQ